MKDMSVLETKLCRDIPLHTTTTDPAPFCVRITCYGSLTKYRRTLLGGLTIYIGPYIFFRFYDLYKMGMITLYLLTHWNSRDDLNSFVRSVIPSFFFLSSYVAACIYTVTSRKVIMLSGLCLNTYETVLVEIVLAGRCLAVGETFLKTMWKAVSCV